MRRIRRLHQRIFEQSLPCLNNPDSSSVRGFFLSSRLSANQTTSFSSIKGTKNNYSLQPKWKKTTKKNTLISFSKINHLFFFLVMWHDFLFYQCGDLQCSLIRCDPPLYFFLPCVTLWLSASSQANLFMLYFCKCDSLCPYVECHWTSELLTKPLIWLKLI